MRLLKVSFMLVRKRIRQLVWIEYQSISGDINICDDHFLTARPSRQIELTSLCIHNKSFIVVTNSRHELIIQYLIRSVMSLFPISYSANKLQNEPSY